jgi:parvulin-like peptidyl-prolyl isomerase
VRRACPAHWSKPRRPNCAAKRLRRAALGRLHRGGGQFRAGDQQRGACPHGAVEDSLAKEGGQRPPQAQLAREVLERLILEKAQIQYAKEIGIKVDDYAVDQGMEAVARNNSISKAQLLRELKKEGIAEASSATSCATR